MELIKEYCFRGLGENNKWYYGYPLEIDGFIYLLVDFDNNKQPITIKIDTETLSKFYKTLSTFKNNENIDVYVGDIVLVEKYESNIFYEIIISDENNNDMLFGSSVISRKLIGNKFLK